MGLQRDEELDSVYKIHRDYIAHEDNLIHQRTSWMITIQSFLIATFGLSYQKRYEFIAQYYAANKKMPCFPPIDSDYTIFLISLCCIGAGTALATLFSVYAAIRALRRVRNNWRDLVGQWHPRYLPGITGGGDRIASKHGITLSIWVPAFFLAIWIAALSYLVHLRIVGEIQDECQNSVSSVVQKNQAAVPAVSARMKNPTPNP